MEITNLLDIHTRAELYQWYLENHDKVSDFWLRINRAEADCPGVVRYVDAVEVALCFGWIDSTQKKIDEGKPVQHFTPRRKRSNWCERNLIRCRRLVQIGDMTPAGLAVAPDLNPSLFVFEDWVLDALKADEKAWANSIHYRKPTAASGWITFSIIGKPAGRKKPGRPFKSLYRPAMLAKCKQAGMISED